MQDLSLHILDIAENSISALAKRIEIRIDEDQTNDLLTVEIKDDGKGMDEQTLKKAIDPFFTTRTTREVGLGLSLLAQAAQQADGRIELSSAPGGGTTVKATFRFTHPDCKPVGEIHETIRTLIAGNPNIDFLYEHKRNDSTYRFDTREMNRK